MSYGGIVVDESSYEGTIFDDELKMREKYIELLNSELEKNKKKLRRINEEIELLNNSIKWGAENYFNEFMGYYNGASSAVLGNEYRNDPKCLFLEKLSGLNVNSIFVPVDRARRKVREGVFDMKIFELEFCDDYRFIGENEGGLVKSVNRLIESPNKLIRFYTCPSCYEKEAEDAVKLAKEISMKDRIGVVYDTRNDIIAASALGECWNYLGGEER